LKTLSIDEISYEKLKELSRNEGKTISKMFDIVCDAYQKEDLK